MTFDGYSCRITLIQVNMVLNWYFVVFQVSTASQSRGDSDPKIAGNSAERLDGNMQQ